MAAPSVKCQRGVHDFDPRTRRCRRRGCTVVLDLPGQGRLWQGVADAEPIRGAQTSMFGEVEEDPVARRKREQQGPEGQAGMFNPGAVPAYYPPSTYLKNPFFSPPAVSYTIWQDRPGAYAQNPGDEQPWVGQYGADPSWRPGRMANPPGWRPGYVANPQGEPWGGNYGEGGWRAGAGAANPPDPMPGWLPGAPNTGYRVATWGPGMHVNPANTMPEFPFPTPPGWRPGLTANPCHEWGVPPGTPAIDFTPRAPRGKNPKKRRVVKSTKCVTMTKASNPPKKRGKRGKKSGAGDNARRNLADFNRRTKIARDMRAKGYSNQAIRQVTGIVISRGKKRASARPPVSVKIQPKLMALAKRMRAAGYSRPDIERTLAQADPSWASRVRAKRRWRSAKVKQAGRRKR